MSIFDRLSPERIAKAYQHPEGGKFIRQSDAKQLAAEHKELADGAKKELDNLGEQMRGTPEGAAEAASPADHFAAVGYHVKEAAAHGAAAQTEARQAHTAAAHAHYKAGHSNSEASSEKARAATEEAHAAAKGNDNFKPVPVRKADVLDGVRKFNENHGSDGKFISGGEADRNSPGTWPGYTKHSQRYEESGGSSTFHPGGTPQDHKDVDAMHSKLISSLTQHDTRVSANEAKQGAVNIHRMPLLFQAAQDAKATAHKLVDSGSPASYAHSVALDKHFNKGFSPIDRFQQKYYGNVQKDAGDLTDAFGRVQKISSKRPRSRQPYIEGGGWPLNERGGRVRKFNENHGADGRFSAGGSDYSMQGGQPAKAVYGKDFITGHHKVVGYEQGDKTTADYNKYKPAPGDHVITEGNKYEGMNPDEYMAKLKAETAAEKAKGGHWSKGLNFSKG